MPDNAIRKILTTQVKTVEGKERVLDFIGTTELPDRDGEVIKADAWQVERYIKNPVVQWAHRYDEPPIGKTLSITQNAKHETIFEVEFATKDTYEFADTIFKLCKGGFLSATSVGFIPIESQPGKKEGDPKRTFLKVELLEISIVPVPTNPDALVTARKAGLISVKEFEFVTKVERKEPKAISQAAIKDEFDYVMTLIKAGDLNDDNKKLVEELAKSISALQGATIPVDIKSPIRSMVKPVIKLLDSHHAAHLACYLGCKSALDAMCETPEDNKDFSPLDYLKEEIKRQMEDK